MHFDMRKYVLKFPLLSSKKNIIFLTEVTMRKMDKNVLTCRELTDMVTLWLCHSNPQALFRFKTTQKVPEVGSAFLKKCISYLILRLFPWIFSDHSQQALLSLNSQLKAQYKQMMVESCFRSNATFQIFIIIIIKQTTLFLAQSFNNVMVDGVLESEMCVTLVYTFLGLEVTQKTYELIYRKYLGKEAGGNKGSELSKTSKNGIDGNVCKSSKKLMNFKTNKGSGQSRRSHQSVRKVQRDSMQRQHLQEFSLLLKENLHVEPLPPLRRKKRNIRELQHLNTEPCEANERSLSKSDEFSPKKCIYSNQLSNSFKMGHPESLLFELTSKKVKLNQSFHNFKLGRKTEMLRSVSPEGVLNRSLETQSSHASVPKGILNWQQIVSELKKKSIDPKKKKKQQQKRQEEQSPSQMQQISQQSSLHSTSYPTSTLPTLQKQPSSHSPKLLNYTDSKQSLAECFKSQSHNKLTSSFSIKNFEQAQQRLSNFFKKPKRSGLNKNSIRLDKDSFFSTCSVRKSQLQGKEKINLHADWIINHYKS